MEWQFYEGNDPDNNLARAYVKKLGPSAPPVQTGHPPNQRRSPKR